ncbi:MAG: 3'-5' exonuclease [Spirochaetia bacterium]|nr:3'-5' exonuclease [Spirochaetia bacterium]
MSDDYLKNQTWVAADLETTGLNPWQHEIIEIGAVKFDLTGIIDKFQILIKPENKVDPRSREIHQISNEELEEHGVSLHEGLENFLSFIETHAIIFHNAPFDLSFLTHSLNRVGRTLPDNLYFDNLYLSRKYFKTRASHSLSSLRELLDIDTGDHHRALSDAEATGLIFLETIKHYYEKINSHKKFRKFMRFYRKCSDFQLKLPRNFDKVQTYFNRLIKSKGFVKVDYTDNSGKFFNHTIQPLELMIFNQKIFIKSFINEENATKLIPISSATIHDHELGSIKF